MGNAVLRDVEIYFKSSGTSLRANRFLLCVSSPMLHKMICGPFSESMAPRLELEDVDERTYSDVLDLWCGRESLEDKSLGTVMAMASVADRLEMMEVGAVLEEAIIGQLNMDVCGDVLMGSVDLGLGRVEAAARGLALERFEEVARTEGFMRMDEEAVGSLLDDDGLCVSKEEAALEAVVGWMKGGGGELRGRGLLSKIRYCVMDTEYLCVDAHQLLPAEHADWIDGLVSEALRVKGAGHRRGLIRPRLLGEKADIRRVGSGVRWERYGAGGERRLQGHTKVVWALVECAGRVCSGSWDGSMRVWGGANLEHKRTLHEEEDGVEYVLCLEAWDGHLTSGHKSGVIRVWNVETGACYRVLEGHSGEVICLALWGTHLVSGSADRTVKVWAMAAEGHLPCKRTLVGFAGPVNVLAIWQDKVLSGCGENVRVFDLGTGAHDAMLAGHEDVVLGLAVYGDRLFSASSDGTIREWALGTWAALRAVEAYGRGERQVPYCLAVSGSKLISGSADRGNADDAQQYEVRVWDLGTLQCEHTLQQPGGAEVFYLAAGSGVVLGGVGKEAVVWGRA